MPVAAISIIRGIILNVSGNIWYPSRRSREFINRSTGAESKAPPPTNFFTFANLTVCGLWYRLLDYFGRVWPRPPQSQLAGEAKLVSYVYLYYPAVGSAMLHA